jgi:hypothetical protein
MRSWVRRALLSVAVAAAAAPPVAAAPDLATPGNVPVKATVGAPDGVYLVGEIFFPPIRLCAYQFDGDKVRVIAARSGGALADDVVSTVAETQFKRTLNAGRHVMRLEVFLPNTLGRELDMQLYEGEGPRPAAFGTAYGFHFWTTVDPTFFAGPDSTAWIGTGASRDLSFQWGYGAGVCYVSPY